MTLVLEIEHLTGVAFAAQSPASALPDWPPQPDRVFSALVAAWGERGERPAERHALEWLERQEAPEVAASSGCARSAATTFVPPNDARTSRVGNRSVMPAYRRRQPRRFPAFRPDDPIVRIVWPEAEPDTEVLDCLNVLAAHTPYIGHSTSLTRCQFGIQSGIRGTTARRRVYPGRLVELERTFKAGDRPSPGASVTATPVTSTEAPSGHFGIDWMILEHVSPEGDDHAAMMPDIRAAALVAKGLRNAIMSGYASIGAESAIPSMVSGHAGDGSPLTAPHLAIVPLAFVGYRHAEGQVMGFALVPPKGTGLLNDSTFLKALRHVAPWSSQDERRILLLSLNGRKIPFTPVAEPTPRSLQPAPYVAVARTWATCTPVVLDRHLKAKGNAEREEEMQAVIRRACVNAGLPEPDRVLCHKHSTIEGAQAAAPSARAPQWTGWRLPDTLASRHLTHAVIQFDRPVQGPVLLGAGRFVGLGLCRALDAVAERS